MRWAALAGLLPLVLVAPALDRAAAKLAVSASPVLRGAEALQEKRYDQRVLDDLEAVKNLFPGGRRPPVPPRVPVPAARAERPRRRRVHRRRAGLDGGGARARQPGGHPFRGRRLRRGPGGLPGGAPPRPARREGPLQPLPRLRRDLPDRRGAGEAHRGARARQRPRHAVPRQPDAREGRLPRATRPRRRWRRSVPCRATPEAAASSGTSTSGATCAPGPCRSPWPFPWRWPPPSASTPSGGRGVATPSPATSAGGRSAASASRPARARSSARSASTST